MSWSRDTFQYLVLACLSVKRNSIITTIRISKEHITIFVEIRNSYPLGPRVKINLLYLVMNMIVYLFYGFPIREFPTFYIFISAHNNYSLFAEANIALYFESYKFSVQKCK